MDFDARGIRRRWRDHAIQRALLRQYRESGFRAVRGLHRRTEAGARHACTRRYLGETAIEAGFPAGDLNVVTGKDPALGELLVIDPRVDLITFTGSSAVGRRIIEKGAPTLKRVLLELGGKSAKIILDDVPDSRERLPPRSLPATRARDVQPARDCSSRRVALPRL